MSRVLIVGAGFYGATMARQLADAGHDITVVERRGHVAGNAFTRWSDEGWCHEHVYGAHIFHTSNPTVWTYVNRFGRFNSYRHRVKASAGGLLYSFPINLMTLHQVFGVTTPAEGRIAMADDAEPCEEPNNMELHCLSTMGRTLYQLFVEGYSTKHWGVEPRMLPASTIKRIPVRLTFDDAYFSDVWQGVPEDGYTALVAHMLVDIKVEFGTPFEPGMIDKYDLVVHSGSIDEFCGYCYGRLGYRSLWFNRQLIDEEDAQGCAVVNYCDIDVPFTRCIQHSHFTSPASDRTLTASARTLLSYEYPASQGEPFYPIITGENLTLLESYRKLVQGHFPTVVFGGRLGEFRYLDMHQVIASALARSTELMERLR